MSEIDIQALLDRLPPELREFARLLVMLAETMGEQKLTPVRIEAYHRNLQDVPIPLLALTVDRMIQTIGSDSFRWTALPPVKDIRVVAETIRCELRGKHAWTPCIECQDSPRWREVTLPDGVKMERCPCVARHLAKLTQMGLTEQPLAMLPVAERDEAPVEDYPTRRQLPEPLQDRFSAVTGRKEIR